MSDMKKIKVELDCYELSVIYMSLEFVIQHGGRGLEDTVEKIANILEKECEDKEEVNE